MTVILIVSLVFLIGLGLGIAVFWFFFKKTAKGKNPVKKTAAAESLTFRWKYIMLPIIILALSIIVALIFYPQLTDEVAYRFNPDGSAKSWLSREMITLLMLAPQLLITLTAGAITWAITKLALSSGQMEAISPGKIILLMGNMVALLQIVLGFVMLDIFSYNIYESHLMPIWLFALIVMLAGGIVLAIFFIQAIKRSHKSR